MGNEFTKDFLELEDALENGLKELEQIMTNHNFIREEWEAYWEVRKSMSNRVVMLARKVGAYEDPFCRVHAHAFLHFKDECPECQNQTKEAQQINQ